MQERKPLIRRIMEKIRLKKAKPDILPSEMPALSSGNQEMLNGELLAAVKMENNIEKISHLISSGADIAATDEEGETALQYAADNGCTETAQFLVAKLVEPIFGNEPSNSFTASFSECISI